jgi:DUF1009 family protein
MNAMSLEAYRDVDDSPRIGLIAGWGRYPLVIADALRMRNYRVFCLGIDGHADRGLADVCYDFQRVGLAKMGAHVRYLKRNGVETATMAGKIHKVLIFQRGFLLRHVPDLCCMRSYFPHFVSGRRDRSDDSLLTAAVNGYGRHGITITPATDLVPELLVKYGHISGAKLNRSQQQDVAYGWKLAKQMGSLDVGQSVVVKGQAVLAVEAVEGTDQCIRRAGQLCPSGGFTVVKVAKPQQDMRFDVPTIGIGTLQTLKQTGAKVLAVEADKTVIIDEEQVRKFAQQNGISIVSVRDGVVENELLQAA